MNWFKRHKILVITLSVIVLLLLSSFFYVWRKLDLIQYVSGWNPNGTESIVPGDGEDILTEEDVEGLPQIEEDPTLPNSTLWKDSDVFNVLLIGTDERTKQFSTFARSDSMILMSLNRETKEIKLVSLERGMGVPVLEGRYKGQYDWLTHIFQYGGADLLMKTVEKCFSVQVDRYVRVNFNTMAQAIDAIGGVDVELTQAEVNHIKNSFNAQKDSIKVGMNHMSGEMAVTYSRIRKIDSDWKRVTRQRRVIIAAMNQLKDCNLIELDAVLEEVLPLVQTNLTKLELADLLLLSPTLLNAKVDQMTVPVRGTYGSMTGMRGRTLYAVDFEKNAKILQEYLYGVEEEEKTEE